MSVLPIAAANSANSMTEDPLLEAVEASIDASTKAAESPLPLYLTVAAEIAERIRRGQLAAGERVPSVRALSRQRGLSPTTALAALRHLETQGSIEARPQSGYYVRPRSLAMAPLDASATASRPQQVSVNTLFSRLVDAAADAELIPLGAAVPEASWFPAQGLQRALATSTRLHPDSLSQYGDSYGLPALRRAVARLYADMGCTVDPDEVVITNGGMEALNLALRAVARPGDVIAVESPTYFGFLQIIESFGMRAMEIATDPQRGMSVESLAKVLESAEGSAIRAVLLCPTVSNPLGSVMPLESKRALLALCERHRVALIEDDVYGDLHYAAARPLPIKALDTGGRALLCSSFSKTLAPGMRIGWVIGGERTPALRVAKYTHSAFTATFVQQAVADFLAQRAYARHLQGLRRACEQQVARFAEIVERVFPAGTRISQPRGGFVLWLELPRGTDVLDLHDRALLQGISFAPGPLFSASGQFGSAMRLNCGRTLTPAVIGGLRRLGELAGG